MSPFETAVVLLIAGLGAALTTHIQERRIDELDRRVAEIERHTKEVEK